MTSLGEATLPRAQGLMSNLAGVSPLHQMTLYNAQTAQRPQWPSWSSTNSKLPLFRAFLPGPPSISGEYSFTIPNSGKSSTIQAKFNLGNSQNYFDLIGDNNENKPLVPPAAGSIVD